MSRHLTHDQLVSLRLSSVIANQLEQRARSLGMSVPELMRQALRREVAEGLR